jgi:hypothetical protein
MDHKELLEEYLGGAETLSKFIKKTPKKAMDYRPFADAWTIKEHVIHLVDSEINHFIRWKSIIAQPNSKCYVIDEETWTKNLNPEHEDISLYIEVFRLLRTITFNYLSHIPEKEWDNNYFIREYKFKTEHINLEQSIEMYKNHLPGHIELIERNIAAWENEGK